jgi:hypothetical protein
MTSPTMIVRRVAGAAAAVGGFLGLEAHPPRASNKTPAAQVVRREGRLKEASRMADQVKQVDEHGTTPIFSQLRRRSG